MPHEHVVLSKSVLTHVSPLGVAVRYSDGHNYPATPLWAPKYFVSAKSPRNARLIGTCTESLLCIAYSATNHILELWIVCGILRDFLKMCLAEVPQNGSHLSFSRPHPSINVMVRLGV